MSTNKVYTHSPEYKWDIKAISLFIRADGKTEAWQGTVDLQYTPANEIDFINKIFENIPTQHLISLCKISACHLSEGKPYFKWMEKRNGIWLFSTRLNVGDKDVAFWSRKRDQYVYDCRL